MENSNQLKDITTVNSVNVERSILKLIINRGNSRRTREINQRLNYRLQFIKQHLLRERKKIFDFVV